MHQIFKCRILDNARNEHFFSNLACLLWTHKYSEFIRLDTEAMNYARSEILVPCLVYCSFKQIVDILFTNLAIKSQIY
jgi:hypothetical protein